MNELDEHIHRSTVDIVRVINELIRAVNNLEEKIVYGHLKETRGSTVGKQEDR